MSDKSRAVPVYAWITGQDFNIGDSLLRRPYLAALAEIGPVDVWVRNASPGFLTGLGIDRASVVRTSFPDWLWAATRSALRRRTVIALNAGEVRPTPSRAVLVALITVVGLLAKIRGGSIVWIGATITTDGRLTRLPMMAASRLAGVAAWREAGPTRSVAPLDVCGDWGFTTGTSVGEWPSERDVVAVLMRGDRPAPSAHWLQWLADSASSLGARVVVAVQVESDRERAIEIAEATGADVVGWPEGDDHATQEDRVRQLYRSSLVVVSDRLHALIVGATEGAVPIGWVESSRGKVAAHFAAVGLDFPGAHEGQPSSSYPVLDDDLVGSFAAQLATTMTAVRESFAAVVDQLRALQPAGTEGSRR